MIELLITEQKSAKLMSLLVLSITFVFTAAGLVMETETVLMAVMRDRRCARREWSVRVMRLCVMMVSAYLNIYIVMERSNVRISVIRKL